jgi:hypothetical protein
MGKSPRSLMRIHSLSSSSALTVLAMRIVRKPYTCRGGQAGAAQFIDPE